MNSEGRSTQNPLATLDLSRFRIDSESFVGQVIELGTRFEKLPPNVGDALLGFLRLQGLHYGKRYRSGIAIRREDLEHGVRQALIAMDLGLEARAESDLNQAVDIIAQGDFEACRKRGYEIAFFRLQEMAQMCRALLLRPEVKFLQSEYRAISRWATAVPETWMRPQDDEEDESQLVDPKRDYEAYQVAFRRLAFLRSIPKAALTEVEMAVEARTYDGLLRNLILALALDMESLLPSKAQIEAFRQRCFEEGKMREDVRSKVFELMDRQLESSVEDTEDRLAIRSEFEAEVEFLEEVSCSPFTGVFLLPDQPEDEE
ncbi:MAG: hypothetical protein OXI23_16305 [Gemmatimonadota bacterium]|nr:hypothetical protein [Gemmatimonadota bacterium]